MTAVAAPARPHHLDLRLSPLVDGWQLLGGERALPASVPGTVAGAYRDAGLAIPDDIDARDWWFRTTVEVAPAETDEELVLRFDGLATLAEILLDGVVIGTSESMFEPTTVDVTRQMTGSHELAIHILPLAPRLAEPRKPRARWRTALVEDGNLRWYRTSLLGRAPGFSPGPPIVGPWRAVVLERRRGVVVEDLRVRGRTVGTDGQLTVGARLRALGDELPSQAWVELEGPSGSHRARLDLVAADGRTDVTGELIVPDVERWWPHTHGRPVLHDVRLVFETDDSMLAVDAGRVGFRTLAGGPRPDHDIEADGLAIQVDGEPVFVRGAVWTPIDPVGMAALPDELRSSLELVRDAGMNMLRIPGTGTYETGAFHDLCDELGILVWQDLMFANLDYPFVDEAFRAVVDREAASIAERLAAHPSTAVVCGSSEVEQQVAMLGLDPELGHDRFYREDLVSTLVTAASDAIAIPSAPFGGDLPFRPDRGVANYYGVGGYRRPLSDARTSGVRFAAECLAFSNVPDDPAIPLDGPAWKGGIPRDRGADWDFEDVRDHYLGLLYGVDPGALRVADPVRYLALSQLLTGEVMADVFGEWRRPGSPSAGGLVLWWRDVVQGAGWGLLDRDGRPKAAYHHLRRALAPVAVWTTDEGLGGIGVHVANDRPQPLVARLRVGLYRDREVPVGAGERPIELAPHAATTVDLEAVLGHFVDASYAYRFGPPGHDLVVATLDVEDTDQLLSQAFRFPTGRPVGAESADALGLTAALVDGEGGSLALDLGARRFVHGVRIEAPGFVPDDDAFSIEPSHRRRIRLRHDDLASPTGAIKITAANLDGALSVVVP